MAMLIDRNQSLLLLVDLQERLVPAVLESELVLARSALLVKAAVQTGVPVLASEHYPKGIGPTIGPLASLLPQGATMEKIYFSCWAEPACRSRIENFGRLQIVIAGTETHVCVQQTALDLKQDGFDVFVAADATSTRREEDKSLAMARMRQNQISIVSTEMVVFEWMRRADTSLFRALLPLIK